MTRSGSAVQERDYIHLEPDDLPELAQLLRQRPDLHR